MQEQQVEARNVYNKLEHHRVPARVLTIVLKSLFITLNVMNTYEP